MHIYLITCLFLPLSLPGYHVHVGLKPGQRKVLFTCCKRNDKRDIKVAQLAGSVAEHSAYHHGEVNNTFIMSLLLIYCSKV